MSEKYRGTVYFKDSWLLNLALETAKCLQLKGILNLEATKESPAMITVMGLKLNQLI